MSIVRIKGNAEWIVKPSREDLRLHCLSAGIRAAKNHYSVGMALGEEDVAIGSGAEQPWIVELLRIQFHFETRQRLWPRAVRARNHLRVVLHRLGSVRRGQIGYGELAECSRFLLRVIDKSCLARQHGVGTGGTGAETVNA